MEHIFVDKLGPGVAEQLYRGPEAPGPSIGAVEIWVEALPPNWEAASRLGIQGISAVDEVGLWFKDEDMSIDTVPFRTYLVPWSSVRGMTLRLAT